MAAPRISGLGGTIEVIGDGTRPFFRPFCVRYTLPNKSTPLRKHIRDFFSGEDPEKDESKRVLDVAMVRSRDENYLAVEQTAREGRRVFALVCVPVWGEDGAIRAYRAVEEGDGDAPAECPLRILSLLTPSRRRAALLWRLRCLEHQIREAERLYEETVTRYQAVHSQYSRDIRKSGEMMIERRFLILHQTLSAEQTVRALIETL